MRFSKHTKIVLAILALSSITAFGQAPAYPDTEFMKNLPPVVATIEGVAIEAETYQKAIRLAGLRQADRDEVEGGKIPALTHEQELGVLRLLVETQAMSILAQTSGIEVSDQDLERALAREIQAAGGKAALEARLEQAGTDYEAFKAMRRAQLIQRLYARKQVADVSVSEQEVQEQYKQLRAQGEIDAPERAFIRHILVRAADDTDLAWQAAKESIERARERIVDDGEDFGLVASEMSDEQATAVNGGKVVLPRNDQDNKFQEIGFSQEIGEVSEPFKSEVGYHIIMVERRVPAGPLAYDEIAPRMHEQMLARRRIGTLRKHVLTAMKDMDIKYNVDVPSNMHSDTPNADQEAIESLLNDAS